MPPPQDMGFDGQVAQLLKLHPSEPELEPVKPRSSVRQFARRHVAFSLLVLLPTLLAGIYFGFVAADRYVSEARFVIRMPNRAGGASALASFMQTSGMTRATDDTYAVNEYLLSRDALSHLVDHGQLREILDRPEGDFIWKFPNFYTSLSNEGLFKHYLRLVSVKYDETGGISTLRVEAFRPEDARKIAEALLVDAERLVNRLNDRAREDSIKAATVEIELSEKRALEVQDKLTAFRNREAMIDPARVSMGIIESIGRLSLESSRASAQLAELKRTSPRSPQISSLKDRIFALEEQITKERRRLAGTDGALAPRLAEYERLMLEREFATRTFLSALASLELARHEARRQQIYLERVAEPRATDYAVYPWRWLSVLFVLVISMMVYRVMKTLSASALMHGDR